MRRYFDPVRFAVILAVAAFGCVLVTGGETRTATTTATTTSQSQPATYPSIQLTDASEAAAKAMLARLDKTFYAAVHPPFVVIGNMPPRRVKAMAAGSVVRPAKAMWRSYFRKKPTRVITTLLFRDAKTYKYWAKKLFKNADPPYFGYYRHGDRTMVMNINTGTGTLVHELTHALIVYDFPAVPLWFNEGLASLHEGCRVLPDKIIGVVNWRLPALQKAVRGKALRPLRELVTRDDFYGRQRGLNYAQARYFVMYMQKRGLLRKFYKHFRDNHRGKDAAVKAIEHVFDSKLEKIESDYLKWMMTLRWRS
jgi:hypothetical protein